MLFTAEQNYSAPGSDGFGGVFYHTYWGIIYKNICEAIIQFLKKGWVVPNFNAWLSYFDS